MPVSALKEDAKELEQIISESSKSITSHSVSSLWQQWTRLRSVAQARERALEDTLREWGTFTEKVKVYWMMTSHLGANVDVSCTFFRAFTEQTMAYVQELLHCIWVLNLFFPDSQLQVKHSNNWVLWCNSRLQASYFRLPKHCVRKHSPLLVYVKCEPYQFPKNAAALKGKLGQSERNCS